MFDVTQWPDRPCHACTIAMGCPYSKFSATPKTPSLWVRSMHLEKKCRRYAEFDPKK